MAKIQAPFLSLGATGSVGGVLTAAVWKGIKTMRQKSNPANPNTVAQQAQRSKFAKVVSFWRTTLVSSAQKLAWNRAATASGKPQSGFNAFTSAALATLKALATSVMGLSVDYTSTDKISLDFSYNLSPLDPSAGAATTPTAAKVVYGSSPDNMLAEVTDVPADAVTVYFGGFALNDYAVGDTVYYQLYLTQGGVSQPAGGIMAVVLT